MEKFKKTVTGIKMLVSAAFVISLLMSSLVVQGQDNQKLEKPTLNNSTDRLNQLDGVSHANMLMLAPISTELDNEMGYWSHLSTNNTGDLPFGESLFYAYPRYWNYVFVDSNNRLFTDAGGLFVWNGAYWRKVTADGQQITRVREIVEDNTGNLWLGTIDGLIQLNSSLQFVEKYTTDNSNLKKNDINTLLVEDDGSLWVGHRWDDQTGGGVTIFNEEVIDELDGYTNDIIQRSNGDIWIAQAPDDFGNGGSIYVYRPSNDSSWTYTEDNSGLPHSEVDNFSEDSQGNIWMGHYATVHHPVGGVTKFDGTDWTLFDQDDGLPLGGAWYIYVASDDNVYYTTSDSIMVHENESWSHFTNNNDRFPLRGSTIITEDRDNNLVIGADPGADLTGGGIHIYDGNNWEFISSHTDGGLFSNVIFGADVDTDGNLWFSGFYGATMYDGENWTYFSENDGMSDSYAWKVEATSDGSIWFGVGTEVTRYQNGEFIIYEDHANYAEAIFEDSQGNVWFGAWDWVNAGNEGGILRYDGSVFTVYDNGDGVIGDHVTAFGEDADGIIYASTNAGVIEFDGSSWSEFAVDGQTGIGANELASDADGNLWIDTDGAVKKWDGSSWTTYDDSDGFMGWTTHIEPAPDGAIWLAGGRVQVIRDGHLHDLTPTAGYTGTTSYVITHDKEGASWVGTYGNGLFKYDMSEGLVIDSVEDYPDDQGKRVTVNASGFLMDPYQIKDSDFDPSSWGVEIKNENTWESLNTSSVFSENPNQISVDLPTTMPTGEDLAEHKYELRVGIYSSGEALGYSKPVTSYALDNLAPEPVGGIIAQRGQSSVTLSWNSADANDLKQYEVISVDNPDGNPLVSTLTTSTTLSDAEYSGVQKLAIRARDRHENVSVSSESATVLFPMDLTYEVEERWNLIGLPLDADAEDISNLLSQIEEGTLFEFSGKYKEADQLEPGKGYWAKFDANENYEIPGLPIAELTLDLEEGWNLISGVGASLSIDNVLDSSEILIEGTLSAFNGSYTQSDALHPGMGYWLRASEAGTVTFSLSDPSPAVSKKNKSLLAEAKEKLNKVIISSSEGYQKELYFGKALPDKVDPLSFSLPPKAPGNSFDVRFAYDDMNYTTEDDFVIKLQKEDASEITVGLGLLPENEHQEYVLQEMKGNKVLAEYTVNAENDVKLKNNNLSSIKMQPAGMQETTESLPDKFDLAPSYPNPFNPSTTIRYQLPEQVPVNLEVFDMAGRKVRTLLVGEQQEAGIHTVRFNASTLSSGMYFVRLQAGTFQEIQKITLIK